MSLKAEQTTHIAPKPSQVVDIVILTFHLHLALDIRIQFGQGNSHRRH